MKIRFLLQFILILTGTTLVAQQGAPTCAELAANYKKYQSCATSIPFNSAVGGSSEPYRPTCFQDPVVGPSWFFIEIKTPGTLNIQISQINSNGQGIDVDFGLWGPFRNLDNICNKLTPANQKDCGYSDSAVETVSFPNSQVGDLYVLLIDNYSNQTGTISVTQNGGTGTTNCEFLSSVKILDTNSNEITPLDYCKPETKELVAKIDISDFTGLPANLRFNYTWTKDGVVIASTSNSTSATNTITTNETGLYKVATTSYDISTNPNGNLTGLRVSEDDIALKFHATPTATLTNTQTLCLNTNPILECNITNLANLNPTVDRLTYQWYRNNSLITNANTNKYTPTLPGDYYAKVINAPCSEVITNTIRIKSQPLVQINSDRVICEGDTHTLTSSIPNSADLVNLTYQWYKDNTKIVGATNPTYTINSTNQTLNSSATYTLEVTEQGECSNNSNTVTVRINALPIINTIPIVLEQCDYLNSTLDGIAETNLEQLKVVEHLKNGNSELTLYYFEDAALSIPITTPRAYTNTNNPFNKTIYVKAVNESVTPNCSSIGVGQIKLMVNPTTVSSYPNIAAVCPELNQAYGYINFDAQRSLIKNNYFPTANVNISFHLSPSDASTGAYPLTNTTQIPVGTHTIHTRIISNSTNKCEGVGVFSITIYQAPAIPVIKEEKICNSENFILTIKNNEALAGQNSTVQISYFNSFDDAKTNFGQINPNTPIDTPVGKRSFFIRLYDTTTSCFSIAKFDLETFPNPEVGTPTPIKHCGNDTAVFDLSTRIEQITKKQNHLLVTFYESPTDLANNIEIAQTLISSYSSATKTIYVKVIDPTNNNCEGYTTLTLEVLKLPGNETPLIPLELCNDSGYDIFNLKERENDIITPNIASEVEVKYYESENDALLNNTKVISTPEKYQNKDHKEQTLYIRINSLKNIDSETGVACYRIVKLQLYVREYPENKISDTPYVICVDKNNGLLNPAIVSTKLPTGTYSFIWFKGHDAVTGKEITNQTNSEITLSEAGLYSVRITNISNSALCSIVANFKVNTSYTPESITATPSELIAFGIDNKVTALVVPNSLDYEYSIDGISWQKDPIFKNLETGTQRIIVRNMYGCGSVENEFHVVDFPNYLTPNNDGFHDTWNVYGSKIFDKSKVLIFDRYGKLLKIIIPDGTGWDGSYNGQPLPADDYWFVLQYTYKGVPKEFKSNFSLKR